MCQTHQVGLFVAFTPPNLLHRRNTDSENQSLEEELLQLENKRIDVKSAYEKAALNAHSSRHSLLAKHSFYRQNACQDDEVSATKVKGQTTVSYCVTIYVHIEELNTFQRRLNSLLHV